jgi:hypothetical protein
MNRRQSLLTLSAVAGHALFPEVLRRLGSALAASPAEWRPELVPAAQAPLLAELVETILPETDTPGAKSARVHVFVDLAVKHCRTPEEQRTFLKGLDAAEAACRARHGVGFTAAPVPAREELLRGLESQGDPFFKILKELTVLGYCTSEMGATRLLAYVAVPGEYQGCLDLGPGQKGWAT